MKALEKELGELLLKHDIKRLLKGKPRSCPLGTEPVQIVVNGEKMWVCRPIPRHR